MNNVLPLRPIDLPDEASNEDIRVIPLGSIFGHDPLMSSGDSPGSTQIRMRSDQSLVERYAALMADGVVFPPVIVVEQEPNSYLLADGHHRVEAAWVVNALDPEKFPQTIRAIVHEGYFSTAIRLAIEANRTHGKQLSEGDFKQAYERAVLFRLIEARDTKATQELLCCSERLARQLTQKARAEYIAKRNALIIEYDEAGYDQEAIASEVGVSRRLVGLILQERQDRQPAVSAIDEEPESSEQEVEAEPEKEPDPKPDKAAEEWRKRRAEARRELAARVKLGPDESSDADDGAYPLPDPPERPFVRPTATDDALLRVRDALLTLDTLPDADAALEVGLGLDGDVGEAIRERLDRAYDWLATFYDAWEQRQGNDQT